MAKEVMTHSRRVRERKRKAFISGLLSPALICMGIIMLYPLLHALYLSLFRYRLTRPNDTRFDPLYNLTKLLNDEILWTSILNTIVFTFFTVLIGLLIGMVFALLIDQLPTKASGVRGVIMMPWVIPGVVTGYLFMYMFDYDIGIINRLLTLMGVIDSNKAWLVDVKLAMPAVITAHVWTQVPFYMLMITAGLKSIPQDMKEAAYAEGASRRQEFWHITLPQLNGILVITSLLQIIRNFNNFPIIYTMTNGGPVYATLTSVLYIYRLAFERFDMGYASAVGIFWVLILLLLSIVYVKKLKSDF